MTVLPLPDALATHDGGPPLSPHVAGALQDAVLSAGGQGILPTRLLNACGLGSTHVRTLVRRGVLVRLHHGWYAPRGCVETPWQRHRWAALAHLRASEGALLASHQTALVLAGVAVWSAPLDTVHLMRRSGGRHHARAGLVIHTPDAGFRTLDRHRPGIGTSTASDLGVPVAHAVVQTGLANGVLDLLVAADCALHHGLLTTPDLHAALASYGRAPGVARMRRTLRLVDGRAESPYESVLRRALHQLGYEVEPQVTVTTAPGSTRRIDLALGTPGEGHALAIEVDGAVKYRVDERWVVDAQEAREYELTRLGWDVIRFPTRQIAEAGQVRWDTILARMEARLRGRDRRTSTTTLTGTR